MSTVTLVEPDNDALSAAGLPESDCPPDVVDRLLWRNAARIMSRHAERLDGSCHWCGEPTPCAARRLAVRAAEVARMPWREAWHARNEITGLLPVVTAQLRRRGAPGVPSAVPTAPADRRPAGVEPHRPVARMRTRTWIRVNVVRRT